MNEIEPSSAAEERVKRLKASAKAAKDRAHQMQDQADASAEQLDIRRSRQKLTHLQRKAATSTVKPYS